MNIARGMKARNMMEAARKRWSEEAESKKKRLKEFRTDDDEEIDEADFKAMKKIIKPVCVTSATNQKKLQCFRR